MNRKEREKHQHRQAIIVAARREFAARGFAETTIDHVATAAEFGKGTIYNYFDGKEELFASVIDETLAELRQIVVSTMEDAGGSFEARIEALVLAMLSYALETPESLYLVARELRVPVLGTRVGDTVARLIAPLAAAIEAEQRAGRLVDDIEPLVLTQMLMNMIVGRFLILIRSRFAGPQVRTWEGWCEGIEAVREDEAALRRELDGAVSSVCLVFLKGALPRS